MRLPISGVYKIKGVGDVLTGRVEQGVVKPGEEVGMNIKGLDKGNMPRVGDVMVYKKDDTLKHIKDFAAQIQTLDVPGELKVGYSPIGFVRCGRSACKMTAIDWKVGKETGGKKLEPPHPLVVDSFKSCEGLSRIAFLDGNTAVML